VKLAGKVALVTGAASGIGEACVTRFVAEGARVVGIDLAPPSRALDVAESDAVAFATCDVRDEHAVRDVIAAVVEEHGRIDGVVNSAGVAGGGPVHMVDQDDWRRVIDINLTGTFLVAKYALAQMITQDPIDGERGSIVNLASVEGLEGTAGGSAYNASKGGVVLLTKNMAIDYGGLGIRVNAICPGFIDTPLLAGVVGDPGMEAVAADIVREHKLGRLGRAEEIAAVAAFLVSADASFVTGIAMPVDGGYTAGRDHGVTAMLGLQSGFEGRIRVRFADVSGCERR
jgi:NAD(P)-dependent dehydrogenase (short-subunit alcohol dehydrogenase family)